MSEEATMTEDASIRDYVRYELDQRDQTGRPSADLRARWEQSANWDAAAIADFLKEVEAEVPRADGRVEPDAADEISALWATDSNESTADAAKLPDQLHGAWLGRVAGNMLGKPVEWGYYWDRKTLRTYLEETGAWPLLDYVPAPDGVREKYELREDNWRETTLGNIDGSSRDDDVDYTILGLHILETYGREFSTQDVANEWLLRLPYHQTYTAERAAYRNLINEVPATKAALSNNPYREWIGALIRADIFGYVCPGQPAKAAELAYRDAALSHTGNGIYGEQWAAALVATAFTAANARETADRARLYVPGQSRLAEAIDAVTAIFDNGGTWDEALKDADERWAGYHWVHTVNNAAVIQAALLWGNDDFSQSIGLTVSGALDTDSNAATVGSVLGILGGPSGIAERWSGPLNNKVRSAVFGFNEIAITDLARRTLAIAGEGAGRE